MSNLIITADTTFDLAPDVVKRNHIVPIVSYVSLGEEMMDDYPDIKSGDLFSYVAKSGKLPQTAAANPGDYETVFSRLRAEDDRPIIHIAKSSGISSCYENAVIAAREVEGVYVVDSKSLSGGSGLVVLRAAQSPLEDPEELVADLEAYREKIEGGFVIETLEYLYKGGRCSGLAALGAGILKLRPEIVIEDGKMHAGKKYRGTYDKCLSAFLEERLSQLERFDPEVIYVNHTMQDEAQLKALLETIESSHYFKKVVEYPACAAIATHCGPNCFGIFLIRK